MSQSNFTGTDFLHLARDLVTRDDEPAWRTAISRAYYAAFHAARDYANGPGQKLLGLTTESPEHGQLRDAFLQNKMKREGFSKIHNRLKDLHVSRKKADYQTVGPTTNWRSLAEKEVVAAQKLIELIVSIP